MLFKSAAFNANGVENVNVKKKTQKFPEAECVLKT